MNQASNKRSIRAPWLYHPRVGPKESMRSERAIAQANNAKYLYNRQVQMLKTWRLYSRQKRDRRCIRGMWNAANPQWSITAPKGSICYVLRQSVWFGQNQRWSFRGGCFHCLLWSKESCKDPHSYVLTSPDQALKVDRNLRIKKPHDTPPKKNP